MSDAASTARAATATTRALAWARAWFLDVTGSTRAIALVRILLVCTLWSRFGWDLLLYRARHPAWVLASVLFFIATPLLLVGWKTRIAAFVTSATVLFMLTYLGGVLGFAEYTHHHVFFLVVVTALLPLTPSERSFSLDRYLAVRRARETGAEIPEERGPLWGTRMMMMTVTSLYLYGAIDKMTWSYASGARLHHHMLDHFPQFPLPMVGPAGTLVDVTFGVLAVSSIVLELALAFGLYWSRVRIPLMVAGALFHLLLYVLLPVSTFSATTVLMYLVFLDPDGFHRFVDDVMAKATTD